MSEQQKLPGWYLDEQGQQRWWDGAAWTHHVADAPQAQQAQQAQQTLPQQVPAQPQFQPQYAQQQGQPYVQYQQLTRPQIAADAPVDSAWTWVAVFAPFLSVPLLFTFDFAGYMASLMEGRIDGMMSLFIWELVIMFASLILTATVIVAAAFDYRNLVARGVERPFHWAFAFIGGLVYLIGRHVVLRKVCRTPGWPLWIFIGLEVVTLAIVSLWFVFVMREILSVIPMGY